MTREIFVNFTKTFQILDVCIVLISKLTVKYLPKKQIWIDTYSFHVYKALWEQRRKELVMR